MGKNPSTSSPRKTRGRKSITATTTAIDTAATASSPTSESKSGATTHRAAKDASAAISVAGTDTGDGTPWTFDWGFATGNGTGCGHGKSRKSRVMGDGSLEDTSGICVDRKVVSGVVEPAPKKIKMEAPEFGVQNTPPLFYTRARLENNKGNISSGMKTASVGESKVEGTEVYYSP